MVNKSKIFYLVLIPLLASLTFALEQALVFLPNIQLTVFLILLFTKKLGLIKSLTITLLYVILDNLFSGYFNPVFFIFMLMGWFLLAILTKVLGGKTENPLILALIGAFGSLLYCLIYVIPNVLLWHVNFKDYLIADIPFQIPLIISSFVSILILYKPLSLFFNKVILKESKNAEVLEKNKAK